MHTLLLFCKCHKWHYEFLNVNLISWLIFKSICYYCSIKKNNKTWLKASLLCLSINDRVRLVMAEPLRMEAQHSFAPKSIEVLLHCLHLLEWICWGPFFAEAEWQGMACVQNGLCHCLSTTSTSDTRCLGPDCSLGMVPPWLIPEHRKGLGALSQVRPLPRQGPVAVIPWHCLIYPMGVTYRFTRSK